MEKLLELLNQFEKEEESGFTWRSIDRYDNCVYGVDCDFETEITMYSDLYSKWYGFIKRLVANDKIDQGKIDSDFGFFCLEGFDTYESLLMILSIQDNPIEFLCSILI